jgi:hypothetical protein
MTFIKLLCFDIKNSLLQEYKKLLLVPVIFTAFCLNLYLRHVKPGMAGAATLGDFLLYIFGGMKEYAPSRTEPFEFPALWISMFLFLLFITLRYPYDDLMGYGQNVLVRTRSRLRWWLSKCVWNVFSVLLFFVLGWAAVFLFCRITGMPLSLEISKYMYETVFRLDAETALYPQLITAALLWMPLLTMLSLSLTQMTLSLFVKPIYSFAVLASVLLSSAYYLKPFMLANYAMAIRNDAVTAGGVRILTGAALLPILGATCVLLGCLIFRRYDIINKEL